MTTHRMLPLYEAKMIHHYDHRWATYEADGSIRDVTVDEKRDPNYVVQPRYWVRAEAVSDRLADRWDRDWLLGWRRVARSTDERTFICTKLEDVGIGDSIFVMLPSSAAHPEFLQAVLSSFVFDFVLRQKIGGTNTSFFLIEQIPLPSPEQHWGIAADPIDWFTQRVVQLGQVDAADELRAEIDAAAFHLYGIDRADADYIMETFPIVKRKDEAAHGEYRTKRLILEAYDRLAG